MYLNLGLIVLESLLLALISFFLHAGSRKYGLAPLLLYLAGLVAILQTTSPLNLMVALGATALSVSSLTLVPVILMTILILYEAEGTSAARLAILGIIALSLLVLLVQFGFVAHLTLPGGSGALDLPPEGFLFTNAWPRTLASILAFSGSLLAIVVVHQALALGPTFLPQWVAPGLALSAALLVDDVLFKTLTLRSDILDPGVLAGMLVKPAGGIVLWPGMAAYLHWIAPKLEGYRGLGDRRPLEVVFGTYRSQETSLRVTRDERRRAEEALRASELRFRTTFEQVGVGLAHIDLAGNFLLTNQALAEILGYSQDELQDIPWQDITHPDDLGDNVEQIRRLVDGEIHFYETDKRYLRKDGTQVCCYVTASLVRDQDGSPLYFVAAVEDLTERNATDAHLRQAQKMEAVGQLTGGIAHDFNNLLTVIMGGIQLGMDGDGRDALDEAFQAARRGAELTQRLLAFSRKQSLRPVSLDPGRLLKDMESLLTRTLGETVRIRLEIKDDVGMCLADQGQMENAILNLALNARDAMPRGGEIRIGTDRVRVERGGQPVPDAMVGDYVQVSVMDSGAGIPADDLAKIFDPFFTTKAPGKGSGLGLSMVYGFSRQSNGFVTVESREGQGTAVRLHLPTASA